MAESKTNEGRLSLGIVIVLTAVYLCVILFIRGGDAWSLLWEEKLNELGDFLAGVFTPAALGWLIYGYFLQKTELGLQRQELQKAQETLGKQFEVLQQQADAERQRSSPYLSLRQRRMDGDRRTLGVRNSRAPAHDLKVTYRWKDGGPEEKPPDAGVLDRGADFSFEIPNTPDSYSITACFISERDEKLYQRWETTFDSPVEIQQITRGPQLLKEGESPPLPN